MTEPLERIAVVGAGLVGGSIVAAALAAGVRDVRLTDIDPDVRERARRQPWGRAVRDGLEETVADAQLIIAAVPTSVVPEVLLQAAHHAPAAAILTDAASLKADLTLDVESRLRALQGEVEVEAAAPRVSTGAVASTGAVSDGPRAVPGPGRFVGGHPMAGSERSGPEAADARLFLAATWVLTPTATTDDDVIPTLSAFLRRMGARVVALPPDRHDELVAVVSHLPQVAASALADVAAEVMAATGDAVLSVAGGDFRDTTRIAASDPGLWEPILRGNRDAVLDALDDYLARLSGLRAALAADRMDEVGALLARASAARRRLVPKEDVADVVELVVALDDTPGQLAAALTALGEAAVNVEDLAMRHTVQGQRRGVLLLTVARDVVDDAVVVLARAGFPTRPAAAPQDER